MFMRRITRPFRRLRGKLTLSYTLTSVVTFLCIELIFIGIVFWFANFNFPAIILSDLDKESPQAAPYFVNGTPNSKELTAGLNSINSQLPSLGPPGQSNSLVFLTIVNARGQVLTSLGSRALIPSSSIQAQLSSQGWSNLQAVLNGSTGTAGKVNQEPDNTLLVESPIVGSGGNVQGALILKTGNPEIFQLVSDFLWLIVITGIVVTIIAAIAGSIFGYLTARGITRRLKRLTEVSERWSHGDFSAVTHDTSQDELGQMSRQLNEMAEQLQNLLQARQKLATLEERNRLARDLHDSVKQQIFALSMQIGAIKILLKRDPEAAEQRLHATEQLVKQAQQELTSLIRELRPVALEGKGLVTALRELATDWSQQADIVANVRVENAQTMPLTVEEALFRVAQEALSNVVRHSNANLVQMSLTMSEDTVALSITDNGQGFDTSQRGRMGVGLLSMQERMKALGGDVQVESTPGKGTTVVAQCKRLGVSNAGGTLTAIEEHEAGEMSKVERT